jgi:hypothetical protein
MKERMADISEEPTSNHNDTKHTNATSLDTASADLDDLLLLEEAHERHGKQYKDCLCSLHTS